MGSKKLLRPAQGFDTEEHKRMRSQIDEAKAAAYLERASAAAYEVCECHKAGLVGTALDKVRENRDHWMKEAQGLI